LDGARDDSHLAFTAGDVSRARRVDRHIGLSGRIKKVFAESSEDSDIFAAFELKGYFMH
jgi:hypothetical protein